MADPLSFVPYAVAAGGGTVDDLPASALVAAGLTLLQRCAPLVRALAGRRAGILLEPGTPHAAQWLVALSASDGRGALLLNPAASPSETAAAMESWQVGAVFTTRALAAQVPTSMLRVLLDDAPRAAQFLRAGAEADDPQGVDLGQHFGLALTGDTAVDGSPEECLVSLQGPTVCTHADILSLARKAVADTPFTPVHRTVLSAPLTDARLLARALIAPLLVGGTVWSARPGDSDAAARHQATVILYG